MKGEDGKIIIRKGGDLMKRISIWGKQVPYNSGKPKFSDEVPFMPREQMDEMMREAFARGDDPNRNPVYRRQVVMQDEIGKWGASWNYEDQPYLIPFPAEGSRKAVIIVPGGAYVMKSMEHEGTEVAGLLNQEGVSCFVLWYRTWPYHYPVPYLDVQRAVRYVRYHAKEFGIDEDKIVTLGFSAGGNAVAGSWQILGNRPVEDILKEPFPARNLQGTRGKEDLDLSYTPDEVDRVDAKPSGIALLYAALEVSNDPQCLHMLAGTEDLTPEEEKAWIRKLDLKTYIGKKDPPHFVSYGTKDTVVLPKVSEGYLEQLKQSGVPNQSLVIQNADHGFGSCVNPHRDAEIAAQGWQHHLVRWMAEENI